MFKQCYEHDGSETWNIDKEKNQTLTKKSKSLDKNGFLPRK